ncbi:MAG: hypothetical protein ACHBN1_28095 [Heteroscytonema crispum UTEX LB 1556]
MLSLLKLFDFSNLDDNQRRRHLPKERGGQGRGGEGERGRQGGKIINWLMIELGLRYYLFFLRVLRAFVVKCLIKTIHLY